MANIKSAEKRIKQAALRTQRNRGVTSRLRTAVKKYRATADSERKKSVPEIYSQIDIALKKGTIHKNAAARYKSRLARKGQKG
jgi:small subunit ribosomal protein S20